MDAKTIAKRNPCWQGKVTMLLLCNGGVKRARFVFFYFRKLAGNESNLLLEVHDLIFQMCYEMYMFYGQSDWFNQKTAKCQKTGIIHGMGS